MAMHSVIIKVIWCALFKKLTFLEYPACGMDKYFDYFWAAAALLLQDFINFLPLGPKCSPRTAHTAHTITFCCQRA
jgi:hypothetical protein